MIQHMIHGKPDGERLVAEIREKDVSLVSYEYVSPAAGLTTLRPRFFCSIPVAQWTAIADKIKKGE